MQFIRDASRRRLRSALVAGSLVAASLTAAACGGSTKTVTILNTEKIERAIERASLAQRDKRVNVSCPSGVHQKKGLVFSCTAVGRNIRTTVRVTTLDNAGNVRFEAA